MSSNFSKLLALSFDVLPIVFSAHGKRAARAAPSVSRTNHTCYKK